MYDMSIYDMYDIYKTIDVLFINYINIVFNFACNVVTVPLSLLCVCSWRAESCRTVLAVSSLQFDTLILYKNRMGISTRSADHQKLHPAFSWWLQALGCFTDKFLKVMIVFIGSYPSTSSNGEFLAVYFGSSRILNNIYIYM